MQKQSKTGCYPGRPIPYIDNPSWYSKCPDFNGRKLGNVKKSRNLGVAVLLLPCKLNDMYFYLFVSSEKHKKGVNSSRKPGHRWHDITFFGFHGWGPAIGRCHRRGVVAFAEVMLESSMILQKKDIPICIVWLSKSNKTIKTYTLSTWYTYNICIYIYDIFRIWMLKLHP